MTGFRSQSPDATLIELDRRYANVREAMAAAELDALVVSGSEYSGFEGAVTYMSGFQIVHRYAYVVVPADGEPFVVFPAEARYVGEHGTALIEQRLRSAIRAWPSLPSRTMPAGSGSASTASTT